ncbi:ATP-binding cassette, subfamily C, CydCD [Actinopolyspora lacussalsi subsp. righensis]|uniref:ATP-binding cassette, subfamily C, CydCD n=1 Tax=Actinopolyspora righensis TaxID=995060 RepID=A0A1I7A642_9ACTN|nr:thiol reductant ABC exporter subunit CydD [Actinopolyspora righensis]SFT70394.1 ATP-binding cassette, subfamily C, CydCD [Actinopolyspora righensis]
MTGRSREPNSSPGADSGDGSAVLARGPLGVLPRLSPSTRRALHLSGALAVLSAFALITQAWALADALARVVMHGFDTAAIGDRLAVLCGAVLARGVLGWATASVSARAAAGAKEELRALLLDSALRRGPEWIGRHGAAELTTLATKGLDALDAYFTRYLPALVTAAVVPAIVGFRILLADWTSAAIVLVTVPLIPLFAWLVGRYTESRTSRAAESLRRMSGQLSELVRALPVLTAFGRAEAQREAVRRVSERYRRDSVSTLRIAFLSALVLELCASLSVALVAVSIGMRLVSGDLDLTTGLLVLVLAPECYLPLRNAGAAHHASEDGLEAVRRVEEVRFEPPDAGQGTSSPAPSGIPSAAGIANAAGVPSAAPLRVTGLRVARREGHAPDGLDFTAPPGRVTRLEGFGGIGPSGSGKSTTFAVLLGFTTPESGTLRYGETEIDRPDSASWRATVAWIPQRPAFSGGTVTDELLLAVSDQPDGTADHIDEVLRAAAAEHLAGRPIDSLSTGERQRVAVARGLLRLRGRARVLLADEPTAHLDAATAAHVVAALRDAAESGAVVVLASHRPGPAELRESPPDDHERGTEHSPDASGPTRVRELVTARGVGGAALGVLSLLSGIALTATSAWLIARAAQQPPVLTLSVAAVGVRTFALSRAVLRYVERLATHDAAFRLAGRLRERLWDGLVRWGPARTAALVRGDGAARLVDDTDNVRDLVPRVLGPPLTAVGVGGGAVVVQALVLPEAGLLLAVALLLAGVLAPLVALAVQRHAAAVVAAGRREVSIRVLGLLESAAELLSFGAAGERRAELARADAKLAREARRAASGEGAAGAVVTLVMGAAVIGCTALAARAVAAGELAPVLAPLLALVPMAATEAVSELPTAAQQWLPLLRAQQRLSPFLSDSDLAEGALSDGALSERDGSAEDGKRPVTVSGASETDPAREPPIAPGEVLLEDVRARWPGADVPALSGVTLRVPPGSHVAVVGDSGSGKSTTLAVLAGLLPVTSGTCAVGGRVAWCPQDPQLVSTTIRENLRLADPTADDRRLAATLRSAGLRGWEDSLDTVVGTGGTELSGGEARRLALARVLLVPDAEVLLLDEPTAHLDEPTALELLDTLERESHGRTVVRVTHHDREVHRADLVVRIRHGYAAAVHRSAHPA